MFSTLVAVQERGRCKCRLRDGESETRGIDSNELLLDSDFADAHPSAQVVGVDLSAIQPRFVPPNCKFEVDDITKEWTYGEDHFDYIHIRAMTGCIPDWVEFHRTALKYYKFKDVACQLGFDSDFI